jgi:hypothetical protein
MVSLTTINLGKNEKYSASEHNIMVPKRVMVVHNMVFDISALGHKM